MTFRKTAIVLSLSVLTGCAGVLPDSAQPEDKQGPYINLTTYEFHTTVGQPIDFSNISAYDDVDGMLPVYVIDDADYRKAGEYYPVFTARDTTGNVTEVPVTVYVEEAVYVEPEPAVTAAPEAEDTGCEAENAADPDKPCSMVSDTDAAEYRKLFYGYGAEQRCRTEAAKINGSCYAVNTNDGSLWGYGLSEKPEPEPEQTDTAEHE